MIDVDNPDEVLLPGMTANISIIVAEAKNVLNVPAAALKFKPDYSKSGKNHNPGTKFGGADSTGKTGLSPALRKGRAGSPDHGRVFILQDNKPVPKRVTIGFSSSANTEIRGEVTEGQLVIIGLNSKDKTGKKPQGTPFGMTPGGGMRRH
jgi:HlyD family secretion protein